MIATYHGAKCFDFNFYTNETIDNCTEILYNNDEILITL